MNRQQRLALIIAIMASFVAFLDGSVVNVALPAISKELGGGLATQQWVVDAYMITLGALMLLAGSLSDLFGRKKILAVGLSGFIVTSLLCAISPTASFLIISRALQGVAGALLVPSSLAIIISVFTGQAQGKAIGTWTAWTGIAFIFGPLLGGFLVDTVSWRAIFVLNVAPGIATLWLLRSLSLKEQIQERTKLDVTGALLGIVGIGSPVYALIEQTHYGWQNPLIYMPTIIGAVALVAFIWHEKRTTQPMLPLELFKARNFSIGNIATTAIYGGLAAATFLITIFVQQVGGYSATKAGFSLLPVTIVMFFLSPRFGSLAGKFGPRWFMGMGPIVAGGGFIAMLLVEQKVDYWTQLFPGVMLFAIGLAATVAPLTTAVLGSIKEEHAGIGSAVNNSISRIAGLVTVATLGLIIGSNTINLGGFRRGLIAMSSLLIVGGLISAVGISNHQKRRVD